MLISLSNLLRALSLMFAGALDFSSASALVAVSSLATIPVACKAMARSHSCRVARIGRRVRLLRLSRLAPASAAS